MATARPGGGQTFGDDSSSGGGGGGGGDATELVFFLVRLVFYYPKVGVPLLVIAIVWWLRARRNAPQSWSTSHVQQPARAALSKRVDLGALRTLDPEFSQVILEDFAYRLYASAQRARNEPGALAALAPYLSEQVRTQLAAEPPVGQTVGNVVVGALKIAGVAVPRAAAPDTVAFVELSLGYETNVTVGTPPNERTFYLRELWTLRRDVRARTAPPEASERLGCPNCGAPFRSSDNRRCGQCGQVVADGRFAWEVVTRSVLQREPRPPALTSEVAEQGTNLPSVVDPDYDVRWAELTTRDSALDSAALEARTAQIFASLNAAWTSLDLTPARGWISDGMFDYLRYWTSAYAAQGLRNVLENMAIARMERVKVVSDKHFDAVTLRLWASGLDYTIDARTSSVLSGSRSRPRAYSEYWTLIRSASARGRARSDAHCPSCAAPLEVNMAGICAYCSAHVTRGEFDWVLSKIEQDDVYEG